MTHIDQVDPYKVQEIVTLGKADDSKARQLLERVAAQVQPLLRRHQLRVPLLAEFFPGNPNLLGLNVGGGGGSTSEIRIRLRRHGRELHFFDFEHVLGTMLHEMVHNHHGPHNATFYKLLDQYTEECEELLAKGISGSGQGFDAAPAGKVGGRFQGRDLGPHQRRELALKAAQERLKKQALMPTGPRKLGGDLSLRLTCDPRQAAAIAAERRARDNLWCPAETIEDEAAAGHNVSSAIQQVLDNAGAGAAQPAKPSMQPGPSSTGTTSAMQNPSRQQELQQEQQQQHLASVLPTARQDGAASGAQRDGLSTGEVVGSQRQAGGAAEPVANPAEAREVTAATAFPPVLGRSAEARQPGTAAVVEDRRATTAVDMIDLTEEDGNWQASARQQAGGAATTVPVLIRHRPGDSSAASMAAFNNQQQRQRQLQVGGWACLTCTLLNRPLALQCDVCGQMRPSGFTA